MEEKILNIQQEKLDIIQDFWKRQGGFAESWIGSNIQFQRWLPANFRWTVSQGMEDLSTTSSATRRSKKKRRETNAMTREILNKILWLKLQRRRMQHLAL